MSNFSIRGISMSTYGLDNYESPDFNGLLTGAVTDGANYVEFSNQSVIDLNTGVISDWITNGYDQTASFASIGPAIAAAEAKGLNVMLKPQIAAYDPTNAPYTGSDYGNLTDPNLVIANPAAFFASYKAYILKWAELAQEYHVPILSIGNEMLAATKPQYTAYWDDIISSVRAVYSGALTYSALIPLDPSYTAGNEVAQIQFWNKLDFAGFDVYPSLTSQTNPSVSALNAAWQSNIINGNPVDYAQFINQLAASIGKPVIFTETGVASFPGATDRFDYSDAQIGSATTQSDYANQANWWESFFETWAASPPSWLAGIFAWNNDPGATSGLYYTNGYNIDGKPAETVIASWFGGSDYLTWSQSSFVGSPANDRIFLYGNQVTNAVSAPLSFNTTVAISIDGAIINGQASTVHFYINGIDYGAQTLSNVPSSYVDSHGIAYSTPQTFQFNLSGLVSINQLKISFDSSVNVGGPENANTFIQGVSVNGVSLSADTYYPLSQYGSEQTQTIGQNGNASQYGGGYTLVDATPWNTQLAADNIGSVANPIQVNGNGGTDTVVALGPVSDYTITQSSGVIHLRESAGLNQNANLTGIAQVQFSDYTLAFDLNSSADLLVYELYQAAYDRVPDNAGFRFWATYADNNAVSGLTLADYFLAAPEFTQKYGASPSNLQYVSELYSNILGRTPDQAGLNFWLGAANAGVPRDQLLVDFATSPENVQLIGSHTSNGYWTTH